MRLQDLSLYITREMRRNIYVFCGLIAILLIYKHLADDRTQTQRIEALEEQVEELYLCIRQAEGIPTTSRVPTQSDQTDYSDPTDCGAPTNRTESHASLYGNTQVTSQNYTSVSHAPTYNQSAANHPATMGAPSTTSSKFKTPLWIDLNSADSTLLCRIPGIGEKTAAAILRYRKRLGGYTHVAQIAEAAHWVTPDQLQTWEQQWLRVNASAVQQLSVNTADFKDLLRHPYLDYPQVKALFSIRQNKGNISSWDEITATGIFTPDDVNRLQPYLRFD
jgi:DNA uptake protein ComE-like DNA-binding protein